MTAEEKILDAGFEDVIIFSGDTYDDALIGVTSDNRAVYSFEEMVHWLMERDEMTETDAIEWIEYNVIRSLPYAGEAGPIIVYEIE